MDDKDLDDEESQKRITNLGREYSKKAAYRDEHYVADLMDKLFAYRRSKYKNPLLKPWQKTILYYVKLIRFV